MSIDALKDRLPDYAKDLKLNLSSLASEATLTEQQRAGTFIASALASRNAATTEAIMAAFGPQLSPDALTAAKAAAAIMGMNNIYYRFVHLASAPDYKTLPAKLRMNVIGKPGVEKADFELWSLAVSAVNGCGMCIDSHEKVLREAGVSTEAIQAAVRIAATVHAVAAVIDGEEALASSAALAA
ncbi:MAG TPA: carboxymuconolactone decarboxylase family protein [Magnetospirillaceae bacterium]